MLSFIIRFRNVETSSKTTLEVELPTRPLWSKTVHQCCRSVRFPRLPQTFFERLSENNYPFLRSPPQTLNPPFSAPFLPIPRTIFRLRTKTKGEVPRCLFCFSPSTFQLFSYLCRSRSNESASKPATFSSSICKLGLDSILQ